MTPADLEGVRREWLRRPCNDLGGFCPALHEGVDVARIIYIELPLDEVRRTL